MMTLRLLVIALAFATSGCAVFGGPDLRGVRWLALTSVAEVPNGHGNRTRRLRAIRVTFTAERNLAAYAERYGYTMHVEAGLCGAEGIDRQRLVSTTGYVLDRATGRAAEFLSAGDAELLGEQREYAFYLSELTEDRLNHGRYDPSERYAPHDLRQDPVDICFRLSGGNMAMSTHRSNTVRIPAEAIRAALAD